MKALIILILVLASCSNIHAQVVIGSTDPPVAGAILQLKENNNSGQNSTKGFLFPRVLLTDKESLSPAINTPTPEDNLTHTGLSIYHTGSTDICAGVYTWNGAKWMRGGEACTVNILCNSAIFNGTYEVGTPLNTSNNIILRLEVPVIASGETYHIQTNTINGISFSATGTLTKGTNIITLQGSGSPLFGGRSANFIISYQFSNSTPSAIVCPQTFSFFPLAKNKIWGVGYNNSGNYTFGHFAMESASRMVLENNFGTSGQAVYSSGFTFLTPLRQESLTAASYTTHAGWIAKPDIIVHGGNPYASAATSSVLIDSLVTYLNKGGVLILFDDYGSFTTEPSNNSIALQVCKRLFPLSTITTTGGGASGYLSYISSTVNDEITNGVFGDLRGLPWGHNLKPPLAFSGIPRDSVVVYSTGQYIRTNDHSLWGDTNAITIFKHKRLNLFVCANSAFLGNTNAAPGELPWDSGIAYNPFAIDIYGYPIGRTWWGHDMTNPYTVRNSQFFANIMAWAVRKSKANNR